MDTKIKRLPHLTASHVTNPFAPVPVRTSGELEKLATIWNGPSEVEIPEIGSLWASESFDIEFSTEENEIPIPRYSSRPERPRVEHIVRVVHREAVKEEAAPQKAKTPMERATSYAKSPSIYKRLRED